MLYALEMLVIREGRIKDSRRFGIYTVDKLDDLREIISNNETDIWESYYNYAVIVAVPENTLYFDCYEKVLEVYYVSIPDAMIKARHEVDEGNMNFEAFLQVERQWGDQVCFNKVSEYPPCIKQYFVSLQEEENDD